MNCTSSPIQLANYFWLSGDLHRIPGKPIFASVAGQPRHIQCFLIFTADVTVTQNTLTVILSTNGNIIAGFTPVKWEWNDNSLIDDDRALK
jgi:hypothetical protein